MNNTLSPKFLCACFLWLMPIVLCPESTYSEDDKFGTTSNYMPIDCLSVLQKQISGIDLLDQEEWRQICEGLSRARQTHSIDRATSEALQVVLAERFPSQKHVCAVRLLASTGAIDDVTLLPESKTPSVQPMIDTIFLTEQARRFDGERRKALVRDALVRFDETFKLIREQGALSSGLRDLFLAASEGLFPLLTELPFDESRPAFEGILRNPELNQATLKWAGEPGSLQFVQAITETYGKQSCGFIEHYLRAYSEIYLPLCSNQNFTTLFRFGEFHHRVEAMLRFYVKQCATQEEAEEFLASLREDWKKHLELIPKGDLETLNTQLKELADKDRSTPEQFREFSRQVEEINQKRREYWAHNDLAASLEALDEIMTTIE